ncbi:Alpha/Beta hydrolase protein [Mycena pura]|uniref:Alpha/Beta hydrolase protein n=1 Tax=Mycena pura TaxID=153505 RepID=A0AAD6YJR4_9AGAR|nr:Alpha/Beta hydrolase protein [Mycena pura]
MQKQSTLIAGLNVHTYTTEAFATSTKPIFALFVLHGRMGSAEADDMQHFVTELVAASTEYVGEKDLMVVTFDHRNHGSRLASSICNLDWKGNPNHALDMYSIQTGTAKDVSFVMDFLESYLFPLGQRSIARWGVAGISLGGHSTWIVGAADPRVKLVIPIIGCPDYLALMGPRAEAQGVAVGPPHFPENLVKLIRDMSLASLPYTSKNDENPFLGKRVLVLSGGSDMLVPWVASQEFVERLEVGSGHKKYVVYEGVGHEVTAEMIQAVVGVVLREL